MRRILTITAATAILVLAPTATAWAGNPSGSGQPNQSCQAEKSSPGNASSAGGSAFNETDGKAGSVYAGSDGTPSLANGSTKAVSQYDVACYQVSSHH